MEGATARGTDESPLSDLNRLFDESYSECSRDKAVMPAMLTAVIRHRECSQVAARRQ